jgi:hypothetical protein
MNKLMKVGASALCGSLAAVASASAGELTVKGGATATWSSNSGDVTGNPIGMASAYTFTGSGELDGGTTFTLTIAHGDQTTYSASQIALVTPSMGTITIDQSGGGIDRLDDMMPNAWEESTGTSLGTGIVNVTGVSGAGHIEWSLPTDMLPDGLSAHVAWAPRATGGYTNDKGVGGSGSDGTGAGTDVVLQYSGLADGLSLFGGYSLIDQVADGHDDDHTQKVLGATYAVGPVTIGYQWSKDAHHIARGTATSFYENQAYGVSFAVNDDLTLSFGSNKSDRSTNGGAAIVQAQAESLQIGYSMGGATLSIAETNGENLVYNTANDKDATTVALSLAF